MREAGDSRRTRARIETLLVAALAAGCAVAVAACGGSGATGYHNPEYPYGAPNVPFSRRRSSAQVARRLWRDRPVPMR